MRLKHVLAAAALLPSSLVAHADTVLSFNVVGSESGYAIARGGNGDIIPISGTLSGFAFVDETTNQIYTMVEGNDIAGYDNFTYDGTGPFFSGCSGDCPPPGVGLYYTTTFEGELTPGGGNFTFDTINNVYYGGVVTGTGSFVAPTPEPSSFALLGTGMLGIAGVIRKRLRCG